MAYLTYVLLFSHLNLFFVVSAAHLHPRSLLPPLMPNAGRRAAEFIYTFYQHWRSSPPKSRGYKYFSGPLIHMISVMFCTCSVPLILDAVATMIIDVYFPSLLLLYVSNKKDKPLKFFSDSFTSILYVDTLWSCVLSHYN
jgi:hypothetical protein